MPNHNEVQLEAFLRPSLIAVAATVGNEGMPQLTPVWYDYRDGAMLISVTKERLKYKNLVRDSRMSVCVYGPPLAKVFCLLPFAVCCLLLVACCLQLALRCFLLPVCCLLFLACCLHLSIRF